MSNLHSFIEAVASSDLETFHSKALVWVFNQFNTNTLLFNELISEANDNIDVVHLGSVAEVANHDMVSVFKVGHEIQLLFWENKIKADFQFKKVSQLPPLDNDTRSDRINELLFNYEKVWLRDISQPFWYQIRWLILRAAKNGAGIYDLLAKLNDRTNFNWLSGAGRLDQTKVVAHWMVLSPWNESDLKIFNASQWYVPLESHCGQAYGDEELTRKISQVVMSRYTPLRFISYFELIEKITNFKGDLKASSKDLVMTYLDYIKGSEHFHISSKSSADVNWDIEKLKHVHQRLNGNTEAEFNYEWLITGSENTSTPLLNIRINAGRIFQNLYSVNRARWQNALEIPDLIEESLMNKISFNIQIQGSVKLQISHAAYHYVKLRDNAGPYIDAVFDTLKERNDKIQKGLLEDRKRSIESIVNFGMTPQRFKVLRENSPRIKTGLSYSIGLSAQSDHQADTSIQSVDDIVVLCHNVFNYIKKFHD